MTPPPVPVGKKAWRAWAADRRQAIPPGIHAAVVEGIAAWIPEAPGGAIVSFVAMGDEIDLSDLEHRTDRLVAITRTPPPGGVLTVHPADAPRERHRYGFDQPVKEAPRIPLEEIGAVLVPGLVFDRRGGRLGRGAGYYDRFLPTLPAGCAFVGVAPSWLVVDAVPVDDHDVPMTHLATELGVRPVSR